MTDDLRHPLIPWVRVVRCNAFHAWRFECTKCGMGVQVPDLKIGYSTAHVISHQVCGKPIQVQFQNSNWN